jgi:ATP-binding cassette, subfamily B, bacterial IrtA/YbtP
MVRPHELTVWQIIRPVRGRINGAIAFAVVGVIAGLLSILLIPQIAITLMAAQRTQVWQIVGVTIILTVVSLTCKIWAFRQSHFAAFQLEEILRQQLATHLATLPLGYVISTGSGAIKKIIQDDVKALHAFVADSTPLIARAYTAPLVTLLALLWTDWRMTLATLTLAPAAMVVMQLAMKDYAERRREYDDANQQINNTIIEFVQGMQVVRTFDDGITSFIRFRNALDSFTEKLKHWSESTATAGRIGYLLFQSLPTTLLTAVVGSWMFIQGWISLPIFLTFLLLAPNVIGSFMPLMMLSHHINASNAAARSIGTVLAEPPLPQPTHPKVPANATVTFDHVSFAYDALSKETADRLALDDVCFELLPGSVTALVGASGAGKSTIAKLLPRLWDVTEGSISIGGVDIREMTSDTLMSWVSFVFQDTFLIQDTLRENIRLGKPDATHTEVEAAAQAAQAHGFILEFPEGYDTIAGERGTRLSGGQRQRITIARAILQNNPIIVLDEATAFADPENEALIQTAIAALTQGKTLLIVAHRLSTIIDADCILVIDRGRVVERGSHKDLIAQLGYYAKLWNNHRQAQDWSLQVHLQETARLS